MKAAEERSKRQRLVVLCWLCNMNLFSSFLEGFQAQPALGMGERGLAQGPPPRLKALLFEAAPHGPQGSILSVKSTGALPLAGKVRHEGAV